MAVLTPRLTGARCASAASASTPPSPLLSARMMKTDIFDGHHDHQRPEDQRHRAMTAAMAGKCPAAGRLRSLLHGVKRRGADIAEHHAQRTQSQTQLALQRRRWCPFKVEWRYWPVLVWTGLQAGSRDLHGSGGRRSRGSLKREISALGRLPAERRENRLFESPVQIARNEVRRNSRKLVKLLRL